MKRQSTDQYEPCALKQASVRGRSGAITVWMIISIPVLLTLLCVVLEVGNLWLARTELTNALEAAALAAVEEWGDNGGGDTEIPREVGRVFALSNTLNGTPIDFAVVDPVNPINYNPANPNDNDDCDGTLIFGAIVEDDPEFVFCADAEPSCGIGNILFDASEQGGLRTANCHEWGIRFLDEPEVPATLTIVEARIILKNGATFQPLTFCLADAVPPFKVVDQDPVTPDAPDIFGLSPAQITTNFLAGNTVIQFLFSPLGPDLGFEKGDRFRFGVSVDAPGPGMSEWSGDDIGQNATMVFVEFSNGTTAMGTFTDTMHGGQFGPPPPTAACAPTGIYDPIHQSLSVTPQPNLIPDLPCAPTSSRKNDGQSYVQLNGGDDRAFAVRAQATYQVPSICCQLFGLELGPFNVSAKADALYDCEDCVPRLYHIEEDNFYCGVPCPIP